MNNKNNDKIVAVAGTLMFHALVVLALFLMAFRAPVPVPGDEGVEVDLGMYERGMGDVNTDNPDVPSQTPLPPQENKSQASEDEVQTQDTEEAPSMETKQDDSQTEETSQETEQDPQPTSDPRAQLPNYHSQEGGSGENNDLPGKNGEPDGTIKDIIGKGQGDNGKGISWKLGGRSDIHLERERIEDLPEQGVIVVDIYVNPKGDVVRAEPGAKGSTSTNPVLRQRAKEFALASKFTPLDNAPAEQHGTITYTFVYGQ